MSFPGGTDGKEPPANAGNAKDAGSIPGWGRSLEEGMATHCTDLAWRSPLMEEPGRLQSMGLPRVRYNCRDLAHTHVGYYKQPTVKVCVSCSLILPFNNMNPRFS